MLNDKIKGVLFGQAIGDALGLGTEFMPKTEVLKHYPNGFSSYEQIIQDRHRIRWPKGAWTDDTEMMLCIANAIIKDRDIKTYTIAHNFKEWFNGNPLGIGGNTFKVLAFTDYVNHPQMVAEVIWNLSNKRSAPNGAVMRTSIVGLWRKDTEKHATEICKLTHYDPRCIGSCAIIALLIRSLVYDNKMLSLDELIKIGDKYDDRIKEYLINASRSTCIEDLVLDDYTMGYTLKTLSAAIWCLLHCDNFEEGLLSIVNAGGDADTNGAVACSLLGAKYGYSNIPKKYVRGLIWEERITGIADELIQIICN